MPGTPAGAETAQARAASSPHCSGYFLGLPGDGTSTGVQKAYALASTGAEPKPKLAVVKYPHRRLTTRGLTEIARKKLNASYFHGWHRGVTRARAHLLARAKNCKTEPITIAGFSQGAVVARGALRAISQHPAILDRVTLVALEGDPLAHRARGISFVQSFRDLRLKGHGLAYARKHKLNLPGPIASKPVTLDECLKSDRMCSGSGRVSRRSARKTVVVTHSYQTSKGFRHHGVFSRASTQRLLFHTDAHPRYVAVGHAATIDLNRFAGSFLTNHWTGALPPGLRFHAPTWKYGHGSTTGTPTQAGVWDLRLVEHAPALSKKAYAVTNTTIHVEPAAVAKPEVTLLTKTADGAPANGTSEDPHLSADGSVVAFDSTATNLVSGVDFTDAYTQAYAWKLGDDQPVLLTDGSGTPGTGEDSYVSSVSPDGRYVVYYYDGELHPFRYDLVSDTTTAEPQGYVPEWEHYRVQRTYDAAKKQVVVQLRDTATSAAVGKACRLDRDKYWYSAGVSSSVSEDGSVFTTVLAKHGSTGDASTRRVAVACHSATGEHTDYPEQQEASVSGDGSYVALTAGTDVAGKPDADTLDGPNLHTIRQIDLATGTTRVPYTAPPLT